MNLARIFSTTCTRGRGISTQTKNNALNFFTTTRHFSLTSVRKNEEAGEGVIQTIDQHTLSSVIEPTFRELGLGIHGSVLPHGILQSALENCHTILGVPWWESIVITTLILRGAVFPIIVRTQKNMIHLASHQPEMNRLREEALKETDPKLRREEAMKIMAYMQENNLFPLKMYAPILANGVVMMSMFFAIRGLTNLPVQSMSTGGIYWFKDLTSFDPTYTLPFLASFTIFIQIQMGADGMNNDGLPPGFKKLLYILPLMSFPVMTQFPSALCVYWLTSNLISLVQTVLLKIPYVKKALNIKEVAKK
uniref:Mitochondrial inner membrane protein OXA1Llike [Aplysia californica] n=1 Tax=Lepeophtheirus salmonis TaxID=72036 RepID=A0A0K2VAA6_LEPSM